MDWRQEAAEKLKQYSLRRQALENIPLEIQRLELEYVSMRFSVRDSIPGWRRGSRREDAMLSNIVCRQELNRQLELVRRWVELVDRGLSALTEDDRTLLDQFYIHRRRVVTKSGNRDKLYQNRDKALRHFTTALYGGINR